MFIFHQKNNQAIKDSRIYNCKQRADDKKKLILKIYFKTNKYIN